MESFKSYYMNMKNSMASEPDLQYVISFGKKQEIPSPVIQSPISGRAKGLQHIKPIFLIIHSLFSKS